jgi:hypothetical protein
MGILVLATTLFYAGCEGLMPAEAEFENQSNYSITVTIVNSKFGIWSETTQEFTPSSNNYFTVYKNQSVRIQKTDTGGNAAIDFKWSGGYEANRKVYVVNDGNKVTFKE